MRGTKTRREQFRARKSEPFAPSRTSQVCHRAVNPRETPERFKGEMRGHVWGGRNVPKSYGAFVVEVQPPSWDQLVT